MYKSEFWEGLMISEILRRKPTIHSEKMYVEAKGSDLYNNERRIK